MVYKCKKCTTTFTNIKDCINHIKSKACQQLDCIDLFCGCGGMSYGLQKAGINIIAGMDIWNKAINSYKQNFSHNAICEDIREFSPEKMSELINKKYVDIIVGGIPCPGFSLAGKRDKADPRNLLFLDFCKYLSFFKPKYFVIENVIGILSMKNTKSEKVIDIIMSKLREEYNCCINKLYASDFGVPQNRRRVIIIGIRKDLNKIPDPIKSNNSVENRTPVKTVLEKRDNVDKKLFLSEKAIDGINKKKAKMKNKGYGFGAQFLNLDKPSYTIPARYWKDGYDALVKYDEKNIRRLSILELKRIQSFPDDYIIVGNRKDSIIQIGNAVACEFAYHIGKYIINIDQ